MVNDDGHRYYHAMKKNVYISANRKQKRSGIQEVPKQTHIPNQKKRVGKYKKCKQNHNTKKNPNNKIPNQNKTKPKIPG